MLDRDRFLKFISFDPQDPSTAAEYFWKYRKNNFKVNWISVLPEFGALWFLYRRMYLHFIMVYFVIGYALTYMFGVLGFDRGASGVYASFVGNAITALLGHMLYIRFIYLKAEKTEHLGTHVRLFMPYILLMRNILFLLNVQIIGFYLDNNFLIKGIYPFLYISIVYTILLYGYYFINWLRMRRAVSVS